MRTLRALAIASLLSIASGAARAEPVLDFLYVESNEGDSSGGHAALRLGNEVFHFQYESGRLLHLERDPWPRFRHLYGRLGNRRIHVRRVAAAPGTVALLRESFTTRLLEEEARSVLREGLASDRRLLEALEHERETPGAGVAALPVEGAGYFSDTLRDPDSPLDRLRDILASKDGPDFLDTRIDATSEALRRLQPAPRSEAWIEEAEQAPLAVSPSFSQRARDLLARLRALEVLRDGATLDAAAVHAPTEDAFRLDAAERVALARYAERLDGRLLALVREDRPDSGRTLLVCLARRLALARSLESGRLVFLDALPPAPHEARRSASPDALAAMSAEAKVALGAARASLVWSEDVGETELADLEAAANRLQSIEIARREGTFPREARALLPTRSAVLPGRPLPQLAPVQLAAARERAETDESAFEARLRERSGYELLTRNCVTEIFRGIDAAFAAAGEEPVQASTTRLGGHVDADGFARFIPFVADDAVARRWRIASTQVLPSERDARVAEMKRAEPSLLVELREASTLTSSVHRLHANDSFFLFFTDGVVLPRPLLGALNLAAGVSQLVAGIVTAPFDGGELFKAGGFGALFSLPELVFVNLRKGTLDWVPQAGAFDDELPEALAQDAQP